MKLGIKQYLAGLILFFVSTLFLPGAVSDFARAESTGTPVPSTALPYLLIGLALILAAAACLGWGYWLTRRNRDPRRPHREDDPDEPLLRPGYGPPPTGQETWREHPLRRPDQGDQRP